MMVGTSLHAEHSGEQTAFLRVLCLLYLRFRAVSGDHSSIEPLDAVGSAPFAEGIFASIACIVV